MKQLADYAKCVAPLAQLGYEHAHWAGLDGNVVFGKGIARTHLVHVVEHGASKWNDYILFRDRLRADRDWSPGGGRFVVYLEWGRPWDC